MQSDYTEAEAISTV